MYTAKRTKNIKKAEIDSGHISVLQLYDSVSVPSSKMLAHIEMMFQLLEQNGIDVSEMRKAKHYKTRYSECKQMFDTVNALVKKHGIDWQNIKIVYINSCMDKKTKKRIRYRTSHRFGCPKGYEYIGTIKQELVTEESAEKEGNESENTSGEGNDNQL